MFSNKSIEKVSYLWIMVLNSDNSAMTSCSIVLNSSYVQRFYGEGVHHSDVDPSLGELVCSLQCLMEGDSSSNHQNLVIVRLSQDLGLANGKWFIIGIYHRGGWAAHTDEANLDGN